MKRPIIHLRRGSALIPGLVAALAIGISATALGPRHDAQSNQTKQLGQRKGFPSQGHQNPRPLIGIGPGPGPGMPGPFSGPGVNAHWTIIPTSLCSQIGITWYRVDWRDYGTIPGDDEAHLIMQNQVLYRIGYYGASHILWTIAQPSPELPTSTEEDQAIADAQWIYDAYMALGYGPPTFELYNEYVQTRRRAIIPPGDAAAAQEYADAYARIRPRLPWNSIVYAGADLIPLDNLIHPLLLNPDAWSYHYYPVPPEPLAVTGQPDDNDNLASAYQKPVLDSEGNFDVYPRELFTVDHAVAYYMGMYNSMGARPWCYWDGPVTSPVLAGLFDQKPIWWDGLGEHRTQPTDTYNRIRAYFP